MSKRKMSGNNKKVIGIVAGVLVVGGVIGGNVYADKELKAIYSMDKQDGKKIKFKKVDYNVGAFSGDITWEAEITIDPCHPEQNIVIKGNDHVTRGFTGYDVHSKIDVDDNKIKQLFDNKPVATVDTHINWFGQADVKAKSPSFIKNQDQFKVDWAGIDLAFKAKKENDDLFFKDIVLNIPNLTVQEGNKQSMIQNIVYKVDQSYANKLVASTSELTIGSIQANLGNRLELNQLKYVGNVSDKKDKFSGTQKFSVQDATFGQYKLNKFLLNTEITDIAKADAQKAFVDINHLQETCMSEQDRLSQLVKAVSPLLEKGFKFNSKQNVLEVNNQKITFDFDGTLNPSTYSVDFEQMIRTVPQHLTFNYGAEIDKGFMRLIRPELTENDIKQIADAYHANVTDHTLTLSGKFENGKPQ